MQDRTLLDINYSLLVLTALRRWINGTKRSRWTPSRYKSSGSLRLRRVHQGYLLDVEITVTLLEKRFENRRCIIMASATSVTWNSSKNNTLLRLAIFLAISGRGSLRAPINYSRNRIGPYFCRNWCNFIFISSMKEWKSTRAFLISEHWMLLKRRSIRYVLPQPGPPQM